MSGRSFNSYTAPGDANQRQSFLHSFHPILLSTFSTHRLIPSLLSKQTVSGCVVCYIKLEKEPHSNTNKQRCDVRASRSSTEVVQHDTIRRHRTARRERWCYFTSVLAYWREDMTVYDLTTDEFFSVTERRVLFCGCSFVWRFYDLLYYN